MDSRASNRFMLKMLEVLFELIDDNSAIPICITIYNFIFESASRELHRLSGKLAEPDYHFSDYSDFRGFYLPKFSGFWNFEEMVLGHFDLLVDGMEEEISWLKGEGSQTEQIENARGVYDILLPKLERVKQQLEALRQQFEERKQIPELQEYLQQLDM